MIVTPAQQRTLAAIGALSQACGYPPTVRELCEAVGLKSTSTVQNHLNALERKGLIRRQPFKDRTIVVLPHEAPAA